MKHKIIKMLILLAFISICFPLISNASSYLYLNQLDFQAQINADGSMNVKETWNIDIEDTNTLFKTFKTDDSKYSAITDVKVTNVTRGQYKKLKQINNYMYHVSKDCYYGLKNSDGDFEIAWNVDLENDSERRTYQVEYKVLDAIAKYNDCAELYWQFLGKEASVSAKSITGTILLPASAEVKDEIRVWAHSKDLNGTIYATDFNKVEFELDQYRAGRYVEVRVLFPTSQIQNTQRVYHKDILQEAISEETKWADEANRQRDFNKKATIAILAIGAIISIFIGIFFLKKIKKYKEILNQLHKFEPTNKLEYFRELPDKEATPGEAVFLHEKQYSEFTSSFGKIFAATMLDLTLKKCISLELDSNKKGKDAILIKLLKEEDDILKTDEANILHFLKNAMQSKDVITMKELEKYIQKHVSSIEKIITKTHNLVKDNLAKAKYFDTNAYKEYEKYYAIMIVYIVFAGLTMPVLTISIPLLINAILCARIKKRINVLTQAGVDQQEMWKGLKKYMEEFSLLKEREVPELVLWEKYLVFATAFGIADKVLKQLKLVYPNIEQLDANTYAYYHFMYHSNFSTNFSNVLNTSIASATYSSGSGSGGGFSGGGGFGGGGRRNGRKIISLKPLTIGRI